VPFLCYPSWACRKSRWLFTRTWPLAYFDAHEGMSHIPCFLIEQSAHLRNDPWLKVLQHLDYDLLITGGVIGSGNVYAPIMDLQSLQ
jgi:hypothetical protein